jgi:hypothetical protein
MGGREVSLEAWGDDGLEGPDGYVTDERADEMVAEAVEELVAALRGLMPEGWDHPDGHMDHMPGIKVARLLLQQYEHMEPSDVLRS